MSRTVDWLRRQAAARGADRAIEVEESRITFSSLDRRVDACADQLASTPALGRVAIVAENGLRLVDAVLACVRTGRTAVLLDPRLATAELEALAASARPDVVLATTETRDAAWSLAEHLGVACLRPDAPPGRASGGRSAAPDGIHLDRAAVVVFSSGTSGRPKPVALTAANLLWSAMGSAARLGVDPQDRWIACLPMTHLGGLSILFRSVLFGTTLILQRGFSVPSVQRALESGATMVSLVPTTLARLLDEPQLRAPLLRCALIGGAGASLDLLERARSRGIPVAPTYGMTETASQIATLAPSAELVETGYVGAPLLPTEVEIRDEAGEVLGPGTEGRIHVRGKTVSPGASGPDGWLSTGDLGRLDAGGGMTVLGRLDDVIVTGGENVSPGEVEAVLVALPGVAEAAVAPVSDPQWGRAVGAWIVAQPGSVVTIENLREAARPRLAAHKLPRVLTLVDELPRTALGKIKRRALRGRA